MTPEETKLAGYTLREIAECYPVPSDAELESWIDARGEYLNAYDARRAAFEVLRLRLLAAERSVREPGPQPEDAKIAGDLELTPEERCEELDDIDEVLAENLSGDGINYHGTMTKVATVLFRLDDLRTENQRLTKEVMDLKDEGPGTPMGRLNWMANFAESRCGHNPVSARGFETSILDYINKADAELVRLRDPEGRLRIAATALIARLKEMEGPLNGIIGIQHARTGVGYTGPNWGEPLAALELALSQPEPPAAPKVEAEQKRTE